MTGANRLLIGVGWSMVVLLAAWRMTRIARRRGYTGEIDTDVHLERPHAIEISFLALATLYSLTLPLKRTLTLIDAVVLIGIFIAFVFRIARSPSEEPHLVGPARIIGSLPVTARRIAVGVMLAFAAGVIFACAEPFAESLVHAGEQAGIDTFLLVQWVAPLASEAPELLVAGLFAWRLQTSAGLGTLLSSKVNQWTLLVGSLPIVFAVSSASLHGLPLDSLQREELFLTAAQSVFAIAVLANRSMSVREAWMLFGLFMGQFVLGGVLPEHLAEYERLVMGGLYLFLAAILLVRQRGLLRPLAHDGLREPVDELFRDETGEYDHGLAAMGAPRRPRRTGACMTGTAHRRVGKLEPMTDDDQSVLPPDADAIVDWAAIAQGAVVGLGVLVAASLVERSAQSQPRQLRPVGVALSPVRGGARRLLRRRLRRRTARAERCAHQRRARRCARVRAVGARAHPHLGRTRREQGAVHRRHAPVFKPGQIFGHLVIASALGMLGGIIGSRVVVRRVE